MFVFANVTAKLLLCLASLSLSSIVEISVIIANVITFQRQHDSPGRLKPVHTEHLRLHLRLHVCL